MIDLPFSTTEYQSRLKRVLRQMEQTGVEALIITRPSNIYYLTGYKAAAMNWTLPLLPLVVTQEGSLWIMTRQIEGATIKNQLVGNTETYKDQEDPYLKLASTVNRMGVANARIGVENANMTASQFLSFQKVLPHTRWVDISGMVERIRIQLSPAEINYYRQAAEVTNTGMNKGAEMLGTGVRCGDIIGEMQQAIYAAGQTDVEVPKMWIWSGPEGGLLHDTDVTRRLGNGDLVTLEVWGTVHQYLAGSQKTYYLGNRAPQKAVESQQLMADMYLAAKEAIKNGAASSEVYHAANHIFRSKRGEDYWRRIGANMGLTFGPVDMGMTGSDRISAGTPFILQLVEVDPFLVTCCATVLLTENGAEELTPPLMALECI